MQNQPSEAELQAISKKFLEDLTALEKSNKWEKSDDKPCLIFTMDRDDRVANRIEIVINLPFDTVFNFFAEPLSFKKVSEQVAAVDVVHKGEGYRVLHIKMNGFGPVSGREMVVVNTVKSDGSKAYIGNKSCDFPVKEDPDLVRAEVYVTGNILEKVGANQTKLISIADIDIKGSVPGFIKNSMGGKRAASIAGIEEKIKSTLK